MQLETSARDCLFLNWALAGSDLPTLPPAFRPELHDGGEGPVGFLSALLFHHTGRRLSVLPLLRFSHTQLTLALPVTDPDGVPAYYFWRSWVPAWALPVSWTLGRRARAARFDYPRALCPELGTAAWSWQVEAREPLEVAASLGVAEPGWGPDLGSWERTIGYFRQRRRAYVRGVRALHRMELAPARTEAWPLRAEPRDLSLVASALGLAALPPLHSAFVSPDWPLCFELVRVPELALSGSPAKVVADGALS
jgi:hypothetical protein